MTTPPVPVSGEDQPDPRVMAIVDAMHWLPDSPHIDFLLRAIDSADRAAGIRRVTEDAAAADRVRAWCEFHRATHGGYVAERLGSSYEAAPLLLADLEALVGGES